VRILEAIGWLIFAGVGPLLWISGLRLFVRANLSLTRKLLWAGLLLGVGAALGLYFPLRVIRNQYLVVLLILPVLAFVDTKLARSAYSPSFWYRACAFEVFTVFGAAAMLRCGIQFLLRR